MWVFSKNTIGECPNAAVLGVSGVVFGRGAACGLWEMCVMCAVGVAVGSSSYVALEVVGGVKDQSSSQQANA